MLDLRTVKSIEFDDQGNIQRVHFEQQMLSAEAAIDYLKKLSEHILPAQLVVLPIPWQLDHTGVVDLIENMQTKGEDHGRHGRQGV